MKNRIWLGLLTALAILLNFRVSGQTNGVITGITEPFLDVLLSAQASGTLRKQAFQEGDFVKKDQVILELDKTLEELAVERRKAVMDNLKTDLDGTRHLFKTTQSVSKDDLDKKELEYKVAVVDYDTALEQLKRRQIIAPMDGFISDLLLDVGEDCKPQDPMVRLVETRRCHFVCHADARAGYDLKVGQKVALEIEAGSKTVPVEGKIYYVSPVVDPASGLQKIKVLFENNDLKIRPGVPGKMRLPSS
jgi:RND family efflux transporter MFP subunit